MLESAKLELVPHSRRVTITIQSRSPELAAALANAYAEAIEVFTDEENKMRCDKAVAGIHQQVERQKRVDDELGDRLLKFRTANKIDNLEAERDVLNQRLQATTADVQEYEKRVGAAREWVNVLEAAKKRPENYGELPTDMPLSADIAMAYGKVQGVKAELAKLGGLTRKHPQVQAKEKELEAHTSEFNASVNRAYATAVADLASNTNQLNAFRRNSEDLKKQIDVIGQQIVKADAGLKQLEQEKKVSGEIYQDLLQKENEQRIIAEQNNELVRVGRPAQIPAKPVAEHAGLYEAKSEFTFDARFPRMVRRVSGDIEEIFNTRQSDWRSEGILTKIIQQYRANFPNSKVTDKEMVDALLGSELKLVPHSRRVTITIQSRSPELAAALANAYAEAIEVFTDDENKMRCDKAVAGIHQQVERQKRVDDELAMKLLDFRTQNKIDSLVAERAVLNQRLQQTTADVLEYEKRAGTAREWVNVLEAAKKHPEDYGELPTDVPLSADIALAYGKVQGVKAELAKLGGLTRMHPQVQAKERELEAHTSEFNASVNRAYATAVADLASNTNQLNTFRRNSEDLKKKIDVIGQQIVLADAGLKQLEQEKKISGEIYQALLMKEHEQRIAAEQNNEIIRVGRPAQIPTKPLGLW